MRLTHIRLRATTAILAVTAATTTAAVLLVPSAASATPAQPSATSVSALAHQLGARSAGAYRNASGRLIVTVTDASAAQAVRAAGATPELVRYGATALLGVTHALAATARIPGTAWAVEPQSDQVVVSVDRSVSRTEQARVQRVLSTFGAAARIEHVAGTFRPEIHGADAIYGGQYRCSLGFNVRAGSTYYFLTAGHCGNIANTWYADSGHTSLLGSTVDSSFPGNDYAIVQYTAGVPHPGNVDLYNGSFRNVASAAAAFVGESVKRSGSTTAVHSGKVQALNATVNYAEGTVTGLIKTNVCAEGGDSGGPLFDGNKAIGLTSGGSGNCTFGGTTFFQPVTEPLSVYGVTVY